MAYTLCKYKWLLTLTTLPCYKSYLKGDFIDQQYSGTPLSVIDKITDWTVLWETNSDSLTKETFV